ncbi:group III truncated hemoglobin [Mucilaginibacter pedocola]|uniref:Globin n=1 Tax=Mucilaginibacter pedocola TaxID=1792845 RepID=A0A1S9PJK9_9SPHI|nr:group III truncated hemoglobin [Mucilaginibacter pedocola]OOQ61142.1 globin [Mucilaginibacter pedocola]
MNSKPGIFTIEDIKLLVDTFYERIKADALLGPVFNGVIQDNWAVHLEKMYRFWQTVLLNEHTYFGRPFPPHANLPVGAEHFDKWLALFTKTVDELFEGEKAEEAKWRAGKMAEMFQAKIAYFKSNRFSIQ